MQVNPAEATPQTGDPAARTGIDLRRFPWVKRLATDYAFSFAGLAPFFAGHPSDESAWSAAIARAQAYPRQRQQLAEAIREQQRRRGAPTQATAAGEQLGDARTVAVLTGHGRQSLRAVRPTPSSRRSALKLADEVSRRHGVPAVTVFWIEAEDHDWDEVRSCAVLGEGPQRCRTVALPERPAGQAPCRSPPLPWTIRLSAC